MRSKSLALTLCVFLCGAALGAISMRVYLERHLFEAFGPPRGPRAEDILARVDEAVSFRPGQKERVKPHVESLMTEFGRIHEESRPRLDELVKSVDAAIMNELDPDQREKFAVFLARMEKMRQSMRP